LTGASAGATAPRTGTMTSPLGAAGTAGTRAATQLPAAGAGVNPTTPVGTVTGDDAPKDGCGCSSVGATRTPGAAAGWLVVSSVLSMGLVRRRRRRL
jgi:hypothetical protein